MSASTGGALCDLEGADMVLSDAWAVVGVLVVTSVPTCVTGSGTFVAARGRGTLEDDL